MAVPLTKSLRRLVQVSNGGGWQSTWIVSMEPGRLPQLTFRLPKHRTVYTIPLSHCLDHAEKAAALELAKLRRQERAARKAVKP